ncbi:MAG: hypothetical protein HUJ69_03390 [Lachnospiraceae bacterium]|nr:hypothetical protein [Lachnospiraceae bacterium]
MRKRIIYIPVLTALIGVNLVLLIMLVGEKQGTSRVGTRELARVVAMYEEAGITFRAQPSAFSGVHEELILGSADLDSMVLDFLEGAQYSMTYIYGAKTQYNSGSAVLLADWDRHSISYKDSGVMPEQSDMSLQPVLTEEEQLMLEAVARRFAQKWLGEDVIAVGWTRSGSTLTVSFAQIVDERIYFFNSASVTVIREGIQAAEISYWEAGSYGDVRETLPMDEVLYRLLQDIRSKNQGQTDEVRTLMDGYVIDSMDGNRAVAGPTLTLIMESGKQYRSSYCHD